MAQYQPPTLDKLIRVRNPADAPAEAADRYGRPTGAAANYGYSVYANRRDRGPTTRNEEGAEIFEGSTVWTIRARAGIDANAEVVAPGGIVYESIGPPVERGGPNGETLARYLEVHTRRRGGRLEDAEPAPSMIDFDPVDYAAADFR